MKPLRGRSVPASVPPLPVLVSSPTMLQSFLSGALIILLDIVSAFWHAR